jgi:hypothetical protein
LREPKDVAWFLASYARDALRRVEDAGALPALASVRSSLEEALGVAFEEARGDHFFRSTLVQTLFYGVFAAWVLWTKTTPRLTPRFDWRSAVWYLNVPFIATLFQQLASPAQLQPLHLIEVLDWTAATLNRVNAEDFIARFNDADAVQFFYEPFLEAFDPELRKELGVWYTPSEIVAYMVGRVDHALREELHVPDGLAADQVYILDPCCGTGAYLSAVLKRIDATLAERGLGGLKGQMVKKAATTRVFGFEILPAPFVVAHLQVGLALQSLGASLQADNERAGIYLTNALTGWEPVATKPLPFPGLEEERKKADKVKQEAPILVILAIRRTTALRAWPSRRSAVFLMRIEPQRRFGGRKAKGSTICTSASSEWPSGALPRRVVGVSFVSYQTTRGSMDCRSRECEKDILTHLMQSSSTICMATG